ncbi:DUF6455 family protein [Bradyrhizobium commune]|uniref:DUF6455 domain-containing protein n=1 Tax=Bradyrhizobium commune TaxID=83627 RepID=A0A7S9D6D7_9BRAD|nr:DUF6455 family protein [Bradyrhizobium commune]QPF92042.1 hypothetical protein IC761_01695 [Bradyrhizobium commune]
MSTASRPYPIVQDLIESFAGWLKHRREINEMRQLDRADFDRIANDLRIAPDDLEELARRGRHAADELPQMLARLGIDSDRLERAQPLLLRDMERVCSLCQHKARCNLELVTGAAAENYPGFCDNAATLDSVNRADLAPR